MPRKAFLVEVELSVQAVTCPGVWLCPNGKVSLQIHMLGSCIQTRSVQPVFPIILQEKFVFGRTYLDVGKLATLQNIFNKDTLYIELIQWQNCENGNVLATFQTSLAELLFPESRRHTLGSAEVDLLMEPMKNFPGILAPKIEVTTKTTIQDKICNSDDLLEANACNPNLLASTSPEKYHCYNNISRQKPVCHTKRCHKLKPCSTQTAAASTSEDKRPPFVVRRVPDDGANYSCHCNNCRSISETTNQLVLAKSAKSKFPASGKCSVRRVTDTCPCCPCVVNKSTNPICILKNNKGTICECGDTHSDNCVVCAKYKHYFENKSIKSQKRDVNYESTKRKCDQCEHQNEDDGSIEDVLCNYPPRRQPTMAQRMHARLSETLNQCNCQEVNKYCSNENCNCDDLQDCAAGTLSQFYKKLYSCSNKCGA